VILITGASGRIGRRVAELLAGGGHHLRLMVRDLQRATELLGAEIVRGDYAEPATLTDAFAGVTTALVVSGSGEPGRRALLHKNAFVAAGRARVQHLVYLSLQGSGPQSKYPFSRDHFASEQYLLATGTPCTILRNAFYIDMFLENFDPDGVVRGPADQGRGAFVSREDVAQTVAAALLAEPSGIRDVTGPEALSISDVARRLSPILHRDLLYKDEPAASMRKRLGKVQSAAWRVDLAVGWFEAIAAGELAHKSDTVLRLSGRPPLTIEDYFETFPDLLRPLQPSRKAHSEAEVGPRLGKRLL
jgi:NAD(P)H dehydrogenase (quinone)